MLIDNIHYQTIWLDEHNASQINVIDQRKLPHKFEIAKLTNVADVAHSITDMAVRGAPLIGITAAYGMYLAALENSNSINLQEQLGQIAIKLMETRPTAINLRWAVEKQLEAIKGLSKFKDIAQALKSNADKLRQDDIESCRMIGVHGAKLLHQLKQKTSGERLNILTHCNAGWLACIDWGTATSPIYQAKQQGMELHVWVSETRPRNQGNLTCYELEQQGIPNTLVTDNASGYLMKNDLVDMVIVGTDRVTSGGDVANKIGTYLKALAAQRHNIPFYVALPESTIDWQNSSGDDVEIEVRSPDELTQVWGVDGDNNLLSTRVSPKQCQAFNPAFDITPAELVTAFITERGLCEASAQGLDQLFNRKSVDD